MSVRLRPSPLDASVVSTASTRPLYGRGAGSTPAGGSFICCADVAQHGKSTGAPPRGGPFDPGRPLSTGLWCNRQHGELQPRRSGFDPWRACSTTDRRGPERLGYLWGRAAFGPCGSTPRSDRTPRPRRTHCCGPERFRLSTPNRQVAGSSPARSTSCSGSSVAEQFRAVTPRPQQSLRPRLRAGAGRFSGRAPGASREVGGSSLRPADSSVTRPSARHDRSFTRRRRRRDVLSELVRDPDSRVRRRVDEYARSTGPASTATRSFASSSRTRRRSGDAGRRIRDRSDRRLLNTIKLEFALDRRAA